MKNTSDPESARISALAELASLTSLEFGKLSEFRRNKPATDGAGVVSGGPYFKHQCWENGRNRSTYIPSEQVEALRQDIENGKRFEQITDQLAAAAIQQSRARRAGETAADTPEKKTSKPTTSPKNTAKRNSSSPKPARNSATKKNT